MSVRDKILKLNESKVFCMMPWVHTHVWPSGNAFPCCMSDSTVEYGNLNDNTLYEIWNNEKYRQLRQNMLNDEETKELTDVDYKEVKLSKVPNPPKGKKIKNLEVVIRIQK